MYGQDGMHDVPNKTEARAAIREARQALRILESTLKTDSPLRDYVLEDEELLAILSHAFYDAREALASA